MSSLITNFFALISQTVIFLSIFFFDFSAVPAVTCVFRLEILDQLVTTVHICRRIMLAEMISAISFLQLSFV